MRFPCVDPAVDRARIAALLPGDAVLAAIRVDGDALLVEGGTVAARAASHLVSPPAQIGADGPWPRFLRWRRRLIQLDSDGIATDDVGPVDESPELSREIALVRRLGCGCPHCAGLRADRDTTPPERPALGDLPCHDMVLGSIATLAAEFGLTTLATPTVTDAWQRCVDGLGLDPTRGPLGPLGPIPEALQSDTELLAMSLADLRTKAASRASSPRQKLVAGRVNARVYRMPVPKWERPWVEILDASGLGGAIDVSSMPRLAWLRIADNDLDNPTVDAMRLERLPALEALALEGNRLAKPPTLPATVKWVSAHDTQLRPWGRASGVPAQPKSPEEKIKHASDLMMFAAICNICLTGVTGIVGLLAAIYSFGLCCPCAGLFVVPLLQSVFELAFSQALGRREVPEPGSRISIFIAGTAATLAIVNFGLLFFPPAALGIVFEILALRELDDPEVRKLLK